MTDGPGTDGFVAAGLYDPAAVDAGQQLALLEYLHDELGVSLPEMMQAEEERRLVALPAFRRLRAGSERLTLVETAERVGLPVEEVARLWRAAGFPHPRPHERRFSERDVDVFALCKLIDAGSGAPVAIQWVRTLGESLAAVAESEVALARASVEAPARRGRDRAGVARAYHEFASELLPRAIAAMDTVLRHHLEFVARRYTEGGDEGNGPNTVDLAIGFADLSDYTSLSQALDPQRLVEMLDVFETITGDMVAAAGAHVVKRLGDAVMFVTAAPGVACSVGLDIVAAAAREPRLPKVRVGLAFGGVIVRQGDFFGPTVNLASRLVHAAEPGTVLVDPALADRLQGVRDRYAFLDAGRITLAGYAEPVAARQLLRADGPTPPP